MRAFFLFAMVGAGYLAAMVIADYPIYPMVAGAAFFVTLVFAGVQNKAIIMFLTAMGLVGYHVAVELMDFPIWPIQVFTAACVIVTIASIARNRLGTEKVAP